MTNRVLVVDDEPRVLGSMARCLRLAGFTVEAAPSGKDALRLCEEHSFDVVVLDFIMPGIDGVELLARIRKIQPLIRALILSGKIDESISEREVAKKLREAVEADLYLNKPVSASELLQAVKNLLTDEPATDWRQTAKRMVNGKSTNIKRAREAARDLKKLRKK